MTAPHRLPSTEDHVAISSRIGHGDPQIRDIGLLESAAVRPGTRVLGHDACADLAGKAAAPLASLVGNDALVDGDNELGWLALVLFLGLNGSRLDVSGDQDYDHVTGVAQGRHHAGSIVVALRAWGIET